MQKQCHLEAQLTSVEESVLRVGTLKQEKAPLVTMPAPSIVTTVEIVLYVSGNQGFETEKLYQKSHFCLRGKPTWNLIFHCSNC